MKKRSLQKKVMTGLILTGISLLLFTTISVAVQYTLDKNWNYTRKAFSYANMIATVIDGDAVARYIDNPQEDEYYTQTLDRLHAFLDETDMILCLVYAVDKEE